LRGDDGIGISVLESLRNSHKRDAVDYLDFATASFDLLHRIGSYDKVLLIDGIDASLKPGEFRIFETDEIAYSLKETVTSSHGLSLKEILEFCRSLGLKTKVYVAGIQVRDASYNEGLTEELAAAHEKIVKAVGSFIKKL
jgi:hydrogenase maturation protease